MRRWLSIFIVLASLLLPLPGVTGRAHAQAGRFTPQQEAWMRQTFLKWVQENESAVNTMYGRTNYWNSAYSWTHTYSSPVLSMFGQTNYWNTAYGWGNWSPRVALMEDRTNYWNLAYSWGDWSPRVGAIESRTNDWNAAFGYGDWSPRMGLLEGQTSSWNTAYGWGDWAVRVALLDGQTNNWNTAYGWGDWGPRVSLLEGQTNNWNAAYGYGPHAGLYDPVGSALAVSNVLVGRTITINGEVGTLSSNLSFTVAGGGGGDAYLASNNVFTGTNVFTAHVTVSNVGDTALSVFGALLVTDTIMGSGLAIDGTVDVPNPEVLVTPYAGGAYSSVRWNFGDIRPGSENFGWSWVTDPDADNTHAYTLFDQSTLYPGLGNPILRFDSNQTFNIYWDTYLTNLYVYGTLYGTATNAQLLAGRSEADISNSVMAAAQALTNGLWQYEPGTSWVDQVYYPRNNPSNWVTEAITNGLASTNWVVAQGYVMESITNGFWRLEDGTNWVANLWWPSIDASAIAATDIANWDTAWGWGDHAGLYDLVGSAAAASNGVIAQLVSSNWIPHASGTALYGSSNGQWTAIVIPPGDVTAAGDNVFSGSNTFNGTVSMTSNLLFKGSNIIGVASVDGILGSEADTVDGYHAASFAILSSNNTFAGGTTQAFDSATVTNLTMRGGNIDLGSGKLVGGGGNEGVSVSSAGNVSIGMTNSSYPFQARGTSFPVVMLERYVNVTNRFRASFACKTTVTNGLPANGLGAGFSFQVEGTNAVARQIGNIYGVATVANTNMGALVFVVMDGDDDAEANERMRLSYTGELNLKGGNSFPTGAAGDIYYHTVSNKHFGHNGSIWNALY